MPLQSSMKAFVHKKVTRTAVASGRQTATVLTLAMR